MLYVSLGRPTSLGVPIPNPDSADLLGEVEPFLAYLQSFLSLLTLGNIEADPTVRAARPSSLRSTVPFESSQFTVPSGR